MSDVDVAITPSACPVCRRAVVVAHLPGTGRVLVERCKRGGIALTKAMFSGDLYAYQADRVSNATTWRIHEGKHCWRPQAFSASSFHTKGQPSTYPPRRYNR
jgi:hypothetical protein